MDKPQETPSCMDETVKTFDRTKPESYMAHYLAQRKKGDPLVIRVDVDTSSRRYRGGHLPLKEDSATGRAVLDDWVFSGKRYQVIWYFRPSLGAEPPRLEVYAPIIKRYKRGNDMETVQDNDYNSLILKLKEQINYPGVLAIIMNDPDFIYSTHAVIAKQMYEQTRKEFFEAGAAFITASQRFAKWERHMRVIGFPFGEASNVFEMRHQEEEIARRRHNDVSTLEYQWEKDVKQALDDIVRHYSAIAEFHQVSESIKEVALKCRYWAVDELTKIERYYWRSPSRGW